MKNLVLFICFLCMIDIVTAVQINEVFPNPIGDDNNKEFVEILSAEFVNLSGFIIGDNTSNDTLIAMQYSENNYSLIVEEGFNFSGINASVYSIGATIGNNLGNSGDAVFFYAANGTMVDTVIYDTVPEGYSYERNASGWFMSLVENGTAGMENSIVSLKENTSAINTTNTTEMTEETQKNSTFTNGVTLTVLFPLEIYTNELITTGFRIENNREEKITATLLYSVSLNNAIVFNDTKIFENISQYRTKDTVAITIQEAGNYMLCGTATSNVTEENFSDNTACASFTVIDPTILSCDRVITLGVDKMVYQNNEEIRFLPVITGEYADLPFIFSYWIEELSGTIVKELRNSSNTNTKQWTPNIIEHYAVYEIHATLFETTCIDTHLDNNHAIVYVIIENSLYKEDLVSTIEQKQETEERQRQEKAKENTKEEEEYSFITFPDNGYVNATVTSSILLYNVDSETHTYKVSSKIYRGPKTYAGADFENRETITLPSGKEKHIALQNPLMNISPGTYKIKIQIQKDDYKTLKEFRAEFLVLEPLSLEVEGSLFFGKNETNKTEDQKQLLRPLENSSENKTPPVFIVPAASSPATEMPITGEILAQNLFYESPPSIIKHFLPYLLSVFVLLFGITLFFYKV